MGETASSRVVVVGGVSGAGKSSVGAILAARLGWVFLEGDELHGCAAIAKMHAGHPLDDADRAPWLDALAAAIADWLARGVEGVLTCSALKRAYRDRLRVSQAVTIVLLEAETAELERRVRGRTGHFMSAALLRSQLDTLERPAADETATWLVRSAVTPAATVERIRAMLRTKKA